jgi:adenylate cyclase
MGIEIERRFRVDIKRLAPNGEDGKFMPRGRYIKQAYLGDDPAVRVRTYAFDDKPIQNAFAIASAILTIKSKGGIERDEWNIPLTDTKAALELQSIARFGSIEKIRYDLEVGSTKWELDRFLGVHEGLWLAEVELPAKDASFDTPPWLGEEVTEDDRFSNARLARTTVPFWE